MTNSAIIFIDILLSAKTAHYGRALMAFTRSAVSIFGATLRALDILSK